MMKVPDDEGRAWLLNELSGYGMFTLWWLLSPEPYTDSISIPVPIIAYLIGCQEFHSKHANDRVSYFQEMLKLDPATINKVAIGTKGQQYNN